MKKQEKFGKLKPRYSLILNQYEDFRASKCTKCEKPTFLRKFPLLIFIEELGLMTLGFTSRYCAKCELIVVHQDELEHELAFAFEKTKPEIIGNDYLIVGTVDKKHWKKGLAGETTTLKDILENTADIKEFLFLEIEPAGWYRDSEK